MSVELKGLEFNRKLASDTLHVAAQVAGAGLTFSSSFSWRS